MAMVAASGASAWAAPAPDPLKPPRDKPPTRVERRNALRHYKKALKLYQVGNYDAALQELHDADDLDPRPDTLYAIAQIHLKLAHCVDAITYLERYLETRPGPTPARAAGDQIAACKAQLPPPEPPKPPAPPPIVSPAPIVSPPPVVAPPAPQSGAVEARVEITRRPWYKDKLGDALVISGLAGGGAAFFLYRGALADLDAADSASSLATHVRLRDDAFGRRKYAIITGSAGAALIVFGVARYLLRDGSEKRTIAVVPDRRGGVVSIAGSF